MDSYWQLFKVDWNVRFFSGLWTGSLIKLVYFSRHEDQSIDDKRKKTVKERLGIINGNRKSYPILGGRLHFVKFETSKINDCLDFIYSKQLHHGGISQRSLFSSWLTSKLFIYLWIIILQFPLLSVLLLLLLLNMVDCTNFCIICTSLCEYIMFHILYVH